MQALRDFGSKTFSSLSVRNYRLYFIGQGISQTGTWMQTVALGWLVLTLSGSGTQLGTVLALQFLPLLFASPWGGMLVDRMDKRRLLVWTQSLSAVLSLLISIFVFTGTVQMWMLYLFAFAAGAIKVVDNPGRQTFISEMVGNEHVKNAVSLNSTMVNLARAIGPTIGGILIASVGIAFCFLVDAFSYAAVIAMLLRIRTGELEGEKVVHTAPSRIIDGFRYVQQMPLIATVLVMMGVIGMFAYEFAVSLPLLAQGTFHGDATTYAALTAAFGAGSAFGGIFSAGRHQTSPKQLITFAFLFGFSILAASLAPTLHIAIVALLFVGFFSINVTSIANTTIQLESRPDMRGRVMSFWNMAIFGSTPLGGPLVGWVGEHIGARWGLALGGTATVVAAGLATRVLSRSGYLRPIPPQVQLLAEEETSEQGKF